MMNRHRRKSFKGNIAFISLVIISSIFMSTALIFTAPAFAETITYSYDDAGQVRKATYENGIEVDYL